MSKPTAPLLPCSPAADLPPDDLLLEVFLRLPPEPGHLLSASRVCRRWRCLVRDPAFLRCFRAFHRTPPVLGVFENLCSIQPRIGRRTRFVPTAGVSGLVLPDPERMRRVLDCRHGRVLFYNHGDLGLIVWDPMAGDTHYVSSPPWSDGRDVTAAVVCVAGHGDHTDCHSSPFHIVFVESTEDDELDDNHLVSACIYSSETSTWGRVTTVASPSRVSSEASALVGLYFLLRFAGVRRTNHILEFELHSQRLTLIELPEGVRDDYGFDIHLMPAEEGSNMGFAHVKESTLHLWSRRNDHREGAAARWALLRMVDLHKFTLPGLAAGEWRHVVAVNCYWVC